MRLAVVLLLALLLTSCRSGDLITLYPESDTTETVTTELVTTKESTTRRETTKPVTTKQETTKPQTTKPETTKPETTKPETTKPETTKPATAKPETTESELPLGSLELLTLTETVSAGKKASVTVKGLPNTEYRITVTYSSVSQAKGLENKYSDESGVISWTWRVGNKTKPGKYKIEIQCETEKITLYFNVTSPQTEE